MDYPTSASLIASNKELFDSFCQDHLKFTYTDKQFSAFTESHGSVYRFRTLSVLSKSIARIKLRSNDYGWKELLDSDINRSKVMSSCGISIGNCKESQDLFHFGEIPVKKNLYMGIEEKEAIKRFKEDSSDFLEFVREQQKKFSEKVIQEIQENERLQGLRDELKKRIKSDKDSLFGMVSGHLIQM